MHAIAHFLCEDIRRIDLPRNMFHRQQFRLYPFADRVFPKLDVPCSLRP
jgi:hypothetical protein